MENKPEVKSLVSKAQGWITVIGVIGAIAIGFVKFASLPQDLTDLKAKVFKLEKQLAEKDVQLEKAIKKNELGIELNGKRIEKELLNEGVENIFRN